MHPPPPGPVPPPPRRPWRMLAVGVALLVVAVLGGGTALVVAVRGLSGALDVRGALVLTAEVGADGTGTAGADLAAGDYSVVALGPGLLDRGGSVRAAVTLAGPAGEVALEDLAGSATTSTTREDSVALAGVSVLEPGPHSLEVTSTTPGVRAVGLVPGSAVARTAAPVVTLVVAVLLGGLVLLVGIVLTVAGAVRRSRAPR